MPEPLLYLKAMGAAAIVSAAFVLTVAMMRWRLDSTSRGLTSENPAWQKLMCVVGVGAALAVGCNLLSIRLTWPPSNALDRLVVVVIPTALAIEMLASFGRVTHWTAWSLRVFLALAIPRILLHGSVYLGDSREAWNVQQTVWVLTASVAPLLTVWGLMSRLASVSPGVSNPLSICLATQCCGLTVMMAGYIKGGAAAFPLAATVAASAISAWIVPQRARLTRNFTDQAIISIGVVGLFGLLFIGRYFGRLSAGKELSILLAPLLCWVSEIPLVRRRRPWIVGSLRLAMVAIPLVMVLGAAKKEFDRDMAPLLGRVSRAATRVHDTPRLAVCIRNCD